MQKITPTALNYSSFFSVYFCGVQDDNDCDDNHFAFLSLAPATLKVFPRSKMSMLL